MEQDKDKIIFKKDYWDNGKLRYKWQFINGEQHGEQLGYYYNGQLWYKLQYLNGKYHGEELRYYLNGELWLKKYYINDKEVSEEEWIKYNRNQKLQSIWEKIKIK